MINYLLAAASSLCTTSQSALTKSAALKTGGASFKFNVIKTGAAVLLFAALSLSGFEFHFPTFVYAFVYAIALTVSTICGYMALMKGPMALTSLIISYSVIIPCLFGLAFLEETLKNLQIPGLVMLFVSMFLLNKGKNDKSKRSDWLFYVFLTFLSNGVCSVTQKLHQSAYPGAYRTEFMLFSMAVSFVIILAVSFFEKRKKTANVSVYALVSGILMGVANLITLYLAAGVNASVLFPMITIFSMLSNVIISRLVFGDRFSSRQLCGILIGVISVILIK